MKSKQVVRIAAHFLLDLSCVGEGEFPMTIRRCKRKKGLQNETDCNGKGTDLPDRGWTETRHAVIIGGRPCVA